MRMSVSVFITVTLQYVVDFYPVVRGTHTEAFPHVKLALCAYRLLAISALNATVKSKMKFLE